MRVIEANQENMKEGEYLEAMNALRDLHRNQEHDEEAITLPFRVQIKRDMIHLWKMVCTPPFDDAAEHRFYTSAQETMEGWIDEDTLADLNEEREHYGIHKGGNFDFCHDCGTCKTCYSAVHDHACECDTEEYVSDSDSDAEEDQEFAPHESVFPDHIICVACDSCICCRCCECKDDDGEPAVMKCEGCKKFFHYMDPRLKITEREGEVDVLCFGCVKDSQGAS